ncbi:CLUMA_CG008583, isoform A [Clunio marinus]|uniref:CLUMA_CG008583, isoform A n=1 Tax=Clunio marinus TaxID=568069 RepID=A0A1J1I9J5_9DIPT|nr:CLUMA_CG008583, isoform A [Clunio marinus]
MNKVKGKNRHSNQESESDESNQTTPALDLSLMRKPIATSVTGFEEVLRAYEAGTNELRKLLSRECDLIYECKVCRNIFRSLTNFISHKRVYCRSSFNASDHFHFRDNGFQVQDISTIIQAEQEINNNPNGAAGILPGADDKSKDLSGIVERLLWKQHQSRTSNLNDFYDQIHTSKKVNHDDSMSSSQKSQTLKLNRVNDSDIAVYQSLHLDNDNSNMKDEINEVHKMLTKSNTVLGPDGKVLNLFTSIDKDGSQQSTTQELSLKCQVCNLPFETEKTLKLHLELKHLPSTYVYQCPSCSQKFSSSAAVIKHLSNDHKKNNRRIRLMRDNIIKKRIRADEVISKPPVMNRELQKLQQSNGDGVNDETGDWNTNDLSGDYQNDSYICPSCFKKFDRKAVYTSHVQACSDAKCREKVKLKKRKAKEETKIKQLLEFEEANSNGSEQSALEPIPTPLPEMITTQPEPDPNTTNKRKRKRTSKVKKDEIEVKPPPTAVQHEESTSVDWNLDDEEEKKKLENIKKEIIEDDYKRVQESLNSSLNDSTVANTSGEHDDDDDDEDRGLVIDEKATEGDDGVGANNGGVTGESFKCPQCDKVFDTDDKLKYHLNTYHSRQKRFKCKLCEYQGYRKKDTINHLNYVHNVNGEKESLENYMESAMKAVDEESLAKQNELKKNQLKIKRRMAREKLKMNGMKEEPSVVETKSEIVKDEPPVEIKIEFKQPAAVKVTEESPKVSPPKIRRKSLHTSILIPPKTDSPDDVMKLPKMFIKTKVESDDDKEKEKNKERKKKRSSLRSDRHQSNNNQAGQSLLNIGKYGKVLKRSPNSDSKDSTTQRPIRNRKQPVRKDFLYDLSDLLKKDADAHREQLLQTATLGCKRELRKRTMSTHTRETPGLSSFDETPKTEKQQPMSTPTLTTQTPNNDEVEVASNVKFNKDPRTRRMSVFTPPTRSMYPPLPRSPIYKPPPEPTISNPNAGAAYKLALREFNAHRASLYEPKFHWSICFDQQSKKSTFSPPSVVASTPVRSAASSILQKLSGKVEEPFSLLPVSTSTTTKNSDEKFNAEQL